MTTFEPGRVYSGVVDGKRETLLSLKSSVYPWGSTDDVHCEDQVTDVRGPLVVLDPDDLPLSPLAAIESLRASGSKTTRWIADQIEEQTRPLLQDGWHEVEYSLWFGRTVRELREGKWYTVPGHVDAIQDWTSTHYIGPGSGDAS